MMNRICVAAHIEARDSEGRRRGVPAVAQDTAQGQPGGDRRRAEDTNRECLGGEYLRRQIALERQHRQFERRVAPDGEAVVGAVCHRARAVARPV